MPVINELVFSGLTEEAKNRLLANTINAKGEIDFCILLPVPINIWQYGVGAKHDVFPGNALDWCRKNWGTKWGPYGQHGDQVTIADDTVTLRFKTALGTPYGWMLAIYNALNLPFSYSYLSEGTDEAHSGWFKVQRDGKDSMFFEHWSESVADEPTTKALHILLWGRDTREDEDQD